MILFGILLAAASPGLAPPVSAGTETPSTKERDNISVALGYIDTVWNQHKPVEGFARYVHPRSIHHPGAPGGHDPKALERFLRQFPDFRYQVRRVLADGDYVVVHSHVTGVPGTGTTVQSPQPGSSPQPKTGDEVVDIFLIRDGKIIEQWDIIEPIGGSPEDLF